MRVGLICAVPSVREQRGLCHSEWCVLQIRYQKQVYSGPVILSVAKDQPPVFDSPYSGTNAPPATIIPIVVDSSMHMILRYAQDDKGSLVLLLVTTCKMHHSEGQRPSLASTFNFDIALTP
jgi:hypothetical protein